jgi:hypothetical protein
MPDPSVRSALTPGRARRRRLLGMSLIAALALFAVAFALGRPTAAQAGPAKSGGFRGPRRHRNTQGGPPGRKPSPQFQRHRGRHFCPGAYTYPTVMTVTGQTAVVLEPYGYTVGLINLETRPVLPPITVGAYPTAVAITA